MYIQDLLSYEQFDDEHLSFLKVIGIDYVCLDIRGIDKTDPSLDLKDGRDRTRFFEAAKAKAASHGIVLYSVFMAGWDEITLGARTGMKRSRPGARCSGAWALQGFGSWGITSNRWEISGRHRPWAGAVRFTVRSILILFLEIGLANTSRPYPRRR